MALVAVVIAFAFAALQQFNVIPANLKGAADAALLVTLAIAIILSPLKNLPLQNALAATGVIALLGAGAHALGMATSLPFGPFTFTEAIGPRAFDIFPWAMPLLWIVLVLTSRGVSRLILRPWRKTRRYGYWNIALTTALTLLTAIVLDPFASHVSRYWIWGATRTSLLWHGAPWVSFFGWLITTLLILAFTTPWLMSKKGGRSPADYLPLIVWWAIHLHLGIGNGTHQLWIPVIISGIAAALVTLYAIRGARW